jgi:D-alanyl-D-alanine carboxypeptidase
MQDWLKAALAYVPQWLDYQMTLTETPGCVLAIAHKGVVVAEHAFGAADLGTREPMTPRHRFRVASHSKTFTAAGIMRLREQGKLRLDDPVSRFVSGLHVDVASATIGQLLSHNAGITRDGVDAGQFMDRKLFLSLGELKAELSLPQPLRADEQFKYSNHGLALAGHIIEAVTGEPYAVWITREIIAVAGLTETQPDMADMASPRPPFAHGHSTKWPYGERIVIPGDASARAITPAAGFVATAGDLARFFAQLSPAADTRLLTPLSRREMSRRHVRDVHSQLERYYGLGTIIGPVGPWSHFGHSGSWPGTLSRTAVIPEHDLAIALLINAVDGAANPWVDSIIHILRTLHTHGAPGADTADWTGRYWTLWGPTDLVPVSGGRVLAALPAQALPFFDASVVQVTGKDTGSVAQAQAFGAHGEPARLERDATGHVANLWIGGGKFVAGQALQAEVRTRYGAKV